MTQRAKTTAKPKSPKASKPVKRQSKPVSDIDRIRRAVGAAVGAVPLMLGVQIVYASPGRYEARWDGKVYGGKTSDLLLWTLACAAEGRLLTSVSNEARRKLLTYWREYKAAA